MWGSEFYPDVCTQKEEEVEEEGEKKGRREEGTGWGLGDKEEAKPRLTVFAYGGGEQMSWKLQGLLA